MDLPVINTIKPDIKDVTIYLRSIKKWGKSTLFRDMIIAKYGEPTKGLLAQCGKEKGVKMLDNANTTRIRTYEDVLELKEYLVNKRIFQRDEKGKAIKGSYIDVNHNIQIVCFDVVDELIPIFEKETIRIYNVENPTKKVKTINQAMGGYQEGQRYTADRIKDYMEEIIDADIGVWAIAHTKFKTVKEKGGLEEEGYQQLTSNLVSAYEAAFGDIFDVTLTGVIDRDIEVKGEGDKQKRYVKDSVRKLYFRGTPLIDAGGRFSDGAVPEYMVFDKPNMAKDFIKVVEEGMERSKTDSKPAKQKPVKSEPVSTAPVTADEPEVEDEPPFDTDEDDIDVDDMFEEEDTDVDSKYPDNLADIIRKEFKELTDKQMKADVRAIISEYGKLNDVPEEGLHRIYDVIHA